MKLAASMIVRNELDRYLPFVIEHLQGFCDEICVLDDFSDDGTTTWLLRQEIRVFARNESTFYVHEGRTRQMLLDFTLQSNPDYVLSIDADEFVGDPGTLRSMLDMGLPVYTLQMEEVWRSQEDELQIRIDGQWGPRRCPILWRAPSGSVQRSSQWKIPDIQLACGREPLAVRRTKAVESGSSVFHFGWANQGERQARADRYFAHDKGRFHKDAHLQSILWPDKRVRTEARPWPDGISSELREKIAARANR